MRNAVVVAVVAVMVAGCMGYVPGRQGYWDSKVKEMCAKDGGVTVYERVKISKATADLLWGQPGLALPAENTRKDLPFFWERKETVIRDLHPRVVRSETLVKRRLDDKVLGKSVRYWRSGGDLPTGASEATSFICPQRGDLSKQIFLVE